MLKLPDTDVVIAAAAKVIAKRGRDFVYCRNGGVCRYVPASDPRFPKTADHVVIAEGSAVTGCLVGEILDALGLLSDEIAKSLRSITFILRPEDLCTPSGDFLIILQRLQDDGLSWGEAFDCAMGKLINNKEVSSDE